MNPSEHTALDDAGLYYIDLAQEPPRWAHRLPPQCQHAGDLLELAQRVLALLFSNGVRMRLNATLVIEGDPTYSRRRTEIIVDFNADEMADLLVQAQENRDEAWQTFIDVYVCPAGWIEPPVIQLAER